MFQKGNTESKKGGRKGSRVLLKKLGSEKNVSEYFRGLREIRRKKRLERLKREKVK